MIADNVIAALEHRDRVQAISLNYFPLPSFKLERLLAIMHHPFPALIYLELVLSLSDERAVIISESFLGICSTSTITEVEECYLPDATEISFVCQ